MSEETLKPEEAKSPETGEAAPVRRGRGRPKATDTGTAPESSKPVKKSKGKKADPLTPDEVSERAKSVMGFHALAAIITGVPEINLSEKDAEKLVKAADNVSREFGIAISGKAAAIFGMIFAAGVVYVPRGIAVRARAKKAQAEAGANAAVDEMPDMIPPPDTSMGEGSV